MFCSVRMLGTFNIERPFPTISTSVRRGLGLALVVLPLAVPSLLAQKTDVVILENGDHITGEIKELTRGRLSYSTDDMGTISIEWEHILRITSAAFYEVEMTSGDKYFGQIDPAAEERQVVLRVAQFSDTLSMASVVRIIPIEATFWQRLSGYIDLRFNFQQANLVRDLTLEGQVRYRTRKTFNVLDFETYFQNQETGGETSRNSLGYEVNRFVARKWTALASILMEQEEQFDLDRRVTLGGGGSLIVTQTNHGSLRTTAELQWMNEQFTDEEQASNDLEVNLGAQGEYYLFDSPKTDITSSLSILPNLTDWGRVRIEFDARLSYELLSDFTVALNVRERFDSRPPSETTTNKNNFSTTLSVGWTF
ncbi:MAG: DUF481 domain-containing protein [Gemmatimonadota bacterium]|nr:MAG: DUF481 domain-containing protein [Gemmatimonadota bacterium]